MQDTEAAGTLAFTISLLFQCASPLTELCIQLSYCICPIAASEVKGHLFHWFCSSSFSGRWKDTVKWNKM